MRQARRFVDRDLAEDAAQEAVLRAWRHRRTCTASDPGPWVGTIARREALRLLARERAQAITELNPDEDSRVQAEELDSADRSDLLAAVGRLSPPLRQALFLHYWADLSHQQIATVLGAPLGTVKLRVYRARMKLRPDTQPLGQAGDCNPEATGVMLKISE